MDNEWTWAYAQLSHQGRMHRDIMVFPNECFYDGTLRILPTELGAHRRQVSGLAEAPAGEETDALLPLLAGRRVIFIPTPSDDTGAIRKVNTHEARLIGRLVGCFRELFTRNGRPLTQESIGVITPYRAQIARIRQVLLEQGIDPDELTVDTVERYQGGARDVILISLCTNSLSQLTSLVSLSEDGVDRKLNVALTRAREHLVILGNPELLRHDPLYARLVEMYGVGEV